MADKSLIEWTDATWNPIRARNLKTGKVGWHCEHATTGCEWCYAEGFNKRLGTGLPFKPGHRKEIEIFLCEEMLTQPLRWKKPRMIFPGSMTDLFADFVRDEWLDKIFAVMALTPQHTFQVLTKRAARMRAYMTAEERRYRIELQMYELGGDYDARTIPDADWPLPNVWLGVSTERQPEANERIPELVRTPAAVRFISYEPGLGPLDLECIEAPEKVEGERWTFNCLQTGDTYEQHDDLGHRSSGDGPYRERAIDWVIVGGESGRNARPMHPNWARELRAQCRDAGMLDRFFFKQWGQWAPVCALHDAAIDKLYKPAPARHPEATRQCLVPQMVMHADGTCFTDVTAPMAFVVGSGAMQMFSVGKGIAGRQLDGVEYNGMPARLTIGAAA